MEGQQEIGVRNSNIVRIGYIKCEDCPEQVICPHAGIREGCRTRDTLKEAYFLEV